MTVNHDYTAVIIHMWCVIGKIETNKVIGIVIIGIGGRDV